MKNVLKMEVEIPEKLLGDLLVTAFDGSYGGSWFWCHSDQEYEINERFKLADPEDVLSEWIHVRIVLDEPDPDAENDGEYTVTHDVVRTGMQRILDSPADSYEELKSRIGEAVFNDDGGCLDANDADTIVQFGLFDEEVYG